MDLSARMGQVCSGRRTMRTGVARHGGGNMSTPGPHAYPRLTYAAPNRQDLARAMAAALMLAMLIGALVWTLARTSILWQPLGSGVLVGVLLVVAWSLRDGL